MTTESMGQRMKDLEETVKSLKHEVERIQAVSECHNLFSKSRGI